MDLTINRAIRPALLAVLLFVCAPGALAQQQGQGGFLDNLFRRGEPPAQQQQQGSPGAQGQAAPIEETDVNMRLNRLENQIRQLTGLIEQLQFRNQQLGQQLQRMQDDTEFRFQQLGVRGGAAPSRGEARPPVAPPPSAGGRRSDVFDPSQHPTAPGAPRALGGGTLAMPAPADNNAQVGAPGGRAAGAPLDLSTLGDNAAVVPPANTGVGGAPADGGLPPPPPRTLSGTGTRLATLPPSQSPEDQFDLGYGYVVRKDYALADQTFRDFLARYPRDAKAAEAQYWLGESLYQRQLYRDAAESFLAVSTRHEKSGKAPDALLRLGQSLAALNQKEAACATLAEVGRKYPRASAGVKRGVAQEQKRARC